MSKLQLLLMVLGLVQTPSLSTAPRADAFDVRKPCNNECFGWSRSQVKPNELGRRSLVVYDSAGCAVEYNNLYVLGDAPHPGVRGVEFLPWRSWEDVSWEYVVAAYGGVTSKSH